MIHAVAKKTWELHTNMTEKELILFADELLQETGDRLDSLDLGDALGALIGIAESEEYAGNLEFWNSIWRWSSRDRYCIVSLSGFDNFEWEGADTSIHL